MMLDSSRYHGHHLESPGTGEPVPGPCSHTASVQSGSRCPSPTYGTIVSAVKNIVI